METALNWSEFQNDLKGFVFKRTKDKAIAEDIVQDVFLKVQDKIGQLKEDKKIFGWVYQITRNLITDHFRKNSRIIDINELDWESTATNFNDCVSGYLNDLLPTLPDKYRIPLEMTELQNLSQLEVSERLNLSYTATKTRVQRARKILKDKMNEALIVKTDAYGNVIVCKSRGACC